MNDRKGISSCIKATTLAATILTAALGAPAAQSTATAQAGPGTIAYVFRRDTPDVLEYEIGRAHV